MISVCILCPTGGDVVAVRVVLSVARSVFVGFGSYAESMVTRQW